MKNINRGLTMVDRTIMVAFIGILAAVVVPARGDYIVHAKVAQAPAVNEVDMSPTELYISLTTGYL